MFDFLAPLVDYINRRTRDLAAGRLIGAASRRFRLLIDEGIHYWMSSLIFGTAGALLLWTAYAHKALLDSAIERSMANMLSMRNVPRLLQEYPTAAAVVMQSLREFGGPVTSVPHGAVDCAAALLSSAAANFEAGSTAEGPPASKLLPPVCDAVNSSLRHAMKKDISYQGTSAVSTYAECATKEQRAAMARATASLQAAVLHPPASCSGEAHKPPLYVVGSDNSVYYIPAYPSDIPKVYAEIPVRHSFALAEYMQQLKEQPTRLGYDSGTYLDVGGMGIIKTTCRKLEQPSEQPRDVEAPPEFVACADMRLDILSPARVATDAEKSGGAWLFTGSPFGAFIHVTYQPSGEPVLERYDDDPLLEKDDDLKKWLVTQYGGKGFSSAIKLWTTDAEGSRGGDESKVRAIHIPLAKNRGLVFAFTRGQRNLHQWLALLGAASLLVAIACQRQARRNATTADSEGRTQAVYRAVAAGIVREDQEGCIAQANDRARELLDLHSLDSTREASFAHLRFDGLFDLLATKRIDDWPNESGTDASSRAPLAAIKMRYVRISTDDINLLRRSGRASRYWARTEKGKRWLMVQATPLFSGETDSESFGVVEPASSWRTNELDVWAAEKDAAP